MKLLAFLVCCLGLLCVEHGKKSNDKVPSKGIMMDDGAIEKMITDANSDVLGNAILKQIEKKEYPFIGKYIRSADPDVRYIAVGFLQQISQPWCYRWFLAALDDPNPQIRVFAGKGILALKTVGDVDEILARMTIENGTFPPDDNVVLPYLVKTVGNIGCKDDISKVKAVVATIKTHELVMADVQAALRAACAKLGDDEAIQLLENKLIMGSSPERKEALGEIRYIDRAEWIPKVVPLLNDRSVAHQYPKGPAKIRIRVCDYAVTTLIGIDHGRQFSIEPQGSHAYPDTAIDRVREMYGVKE